MSVDIAALKPVGQGGRWAAVFKKGDDGFWLGERVYSSAEEAVFRSVGADGAVYMEAQTDDDGSLVIHWRDDIEVGL